MAAVLIVLATMLGLTAFAITASGVTNEPPFGLTERIPWKNTRLLGSPEPPLPYTVERTFTNLTWKSPIYVIDEPGTDQLLVALAGGEPERPSRILRVPDDPNARVAELFLEVPRRLVYALCFHPGYATNGYIYLFCNGTTGDGNRTNRIVRLTVDQKGTRRPDPATEVNVIEWASAGHDGGDLAFGLDGFLYLTTGDGSTDSDTLNSGQTMDDLLGNVLRIDVDHPDANRAYSIPSDNPFVHLAGARPEIWAYGFRNPWRMSIDPKSGRVWVGNNGQDLWETAQLVRAGENYGWSVYEGSHPFYLGRKRGPTPVVKPTIEHSHAEFRSLTGGVVYHGRRFPDLEGAYIYGDYATGRIWGMNHNGRRVLWHRELADTALQIAAFRVDQRGELLVVDHAGGLYHLIPATSHTPGNGEKKSAPPPFPRRLSETGLFASVKEHRVAPGVLPYSVNAPAWTDGTHAERFMAVPDDAKINYGQARGWEFPDGTALFQTLSIDRAGGQATSRKRIETRVLLRQQGEWAGYSYRWKSDQSDATLVPGEGADASMPEMQSGAHWRFPSRAECMVCHSRQANFVLGLIGSQLNRDHDYGGIRDNQLRALEHIGFFKGHLDKRPDALPRMVDPYDTTAALEDRARAYLHVNCAACHVEAGGGNAKMDMDISTARGRMGLFEARPQHDTFGLINAMLVAPGHPERSVLMQRLSRRGPGQMPPLVSHRIDEQAVELMRAWIASLPPPQTFVRAWQITNFLNALPELATGSGGRRFESGQSAFTNVGCVQCHRFAGKGGAVGPDLTGVGRRLAPRDLLEAIIEPSAKVADEYVLHEIELSNGDTVSGRLEREDARKLWLQPLTAGGTALEIDKRKIRRHERSALSPMPSGMVDTLTEEQVLDLLAYLLSDGDAQDRRFR